MHNFERINIITGHYGSGKTNIAVNMAIFLRQSYKKVYLVDLDVVNPYFRSADSKKVLENSGVELIVSSFANTNVDVPAVPSEVNAVFSDLESAAVFDVGGDDVGATVLGRYFNNFSDQIYDMFYVINKYRMFTKTVEDTLSFMREIELKSRLKVTSIVNNSNLGTETTAKIINDSIRFAAETARMADIPLAFTSVLDKFFLEVDKEGNIFPMGLYTKQYWVE